MKPDPLIVPIPGARHRISAKFGHDPRRLLAAYRQPERRLSAEGKRGYASGLLRNPAPEEALDFSDEPPQT